MSKEIFVNLPVNDVQAARQFYTKIGFSIKEEFSNERALCALFGSFAYMLVREDFFREVSGREIADATEVSEVVVAFSLESREEVDTMLAAAKHAGATHIRDAAEEEGIMYSASFRDPFGHQIAIHVML